MPDVVVISSNNRLLWIILAMGLALRLVILVGTRGLTPQIEDEQHYQAIGVNLVQGNGFASEPGRLTSMRPPLYPAFLATIWHVTGIDSLQSVRMVQILLSLLNAWLVYKLGEKLFHRRVGLIAASVFTFYPSLVFCDYLLLTETLFTLLLTLFVYAYSDLLAAGRASTAIVAGLVLALGALTRSVLWPLIVCLVPATFIAVRGTKLIKARAALLLVAGYLAVVAPWSIRNTMLQRRFTVVDAMGGINLFCGNYEHTPHDRPWDAISLDGEKSWAHRLRVENPGVSSFTEGEKEAWAQERALAFMRENPGLTAWRAALKFADFWGLEREFAAGISSGLYKVSPWWGLPAVLSMPAAYVVLMVLASLGVFYASPGNRWAHWFLLLLVLFVCGVHSVVFGHPRYRTPLSPIFILYAAAAISARSWRGWWQHRRAAIGFVVTVLVFISAWVRDVLFRDADRIRELLKTFF